MAVAASRQFGWWSILLIVPGLVSRRVWVVGVLVAGLVSGLASAQRELATLSADLPSGRIVVAGRLVDDPRPYGVDMRGRVDPTHLFTRAGWETWSGPRLAVVLAGPGTAVAGERVSVSGRLRDRAGFVRGDPFAGVIEDAVLERLGPASDPLFRAANAIRGRVASVLDSEGAEGALLAGFLVGDIDGLPEGRVEDLRLAGLSHFVAVSGSNVALFLAVWFIAAGPLGWGPRRRAVVGFVGLALFLVVTRWEPSVVRASMMAGLVLLGRLGGLALTPWVALGAAITTSLLVAGQLSGDVGFQLSVAATAGVVAGSRWVREVGWGTAGQALGITLGAQLAVAPLLLVHFGTVPLLSPLTNLVAAPVVTLATAVGGGAVLTGSAILISAATWLAGVVLSISRLAAGWPQLGLAGLAGVAAMAGLAGVRALRPLVALGVALVLSASLLPVGRVAVPTVVFLDIGQGDATLLLGPSGETILVDGGPDPTRLLAALRARGVDHIDLMIATHGDQDHIGGLGAALAAYPVGRLWHPGHVEGSALYDDLLDTATAAGLSIELPRAGWSAEIGSFRLQVLSPTRRYADINDESIVVRAMVGSMDILLTGDIEATAQAELGPIPVDIMKVPHHGAATTDPRWLEASRAAIAVISVGPNEFGHPHPDVLEVLERNGSEIRRTDREGDVAIPLRP
ncbi:MAG: ComEC/Rec2 family competence protein [Acidimicrobiia bacterium]|nr:ComEC/Rec2 family competence protein [Acidimicrobiia bacterium]